MTTLAEYNRQEIMVSWLSVNCAGSRHNHSVKSCTQPLPRSDGEAKGTSG
jgi:hypothetical protein